MEERKGISVLRVHRSERFWELDTARGIAILMMISYHAIYDLWYFGLSTVDPVGGPLEGLALATVTLFLLIVGVSLTLSAANSARLLDRSGFVAKYAGRGAFIIALGLIITLVTLVAVPKAPILFGILPLIGCSILLSIPFLIRPRPRAALAAGLAICAAGFLLLPRTGPIWLLWLGLHPAAYASIDYEPLLPWAGVVLLGLFLGFTLYPGGASSPVKGPGPRAARTLCLLGRHSLLIYLLHQPVILGAIWLLSSGRLQPVL